MPILSLFVGLFGILTNPSRWRVYIIFILNCIFIAAYSYMPDVGENYDLVRHLPRIEMYGRLSLLEALRFQDDVLFTRDILFWICGHLGLPHLVPALTTSIVYGVAFYITCDTAERQNCIRNIGIVILVQITMLPFFWIINNIRNVCGLSLAIFAAYNDLVKNKRSPFVLFCYLLGCTLHYSVIYVVFARIICNKMKKCFELTFIVPLVLYVFIVILYKYMILNGNEGLRINSLNIIVTKLVKNLSTSEFGLKTYKSYLSHSIYRPITMISATVINFYILYGIRLKKKSFIDNSRVYSFVGLIGAMVLGCSILPSTAYWRFAAGLYVSLGLVLIPMISVFNRVSVIQQFNIIISFAITPIGLLVQFISVKGLNLTKWISNFFSTNYLTIIIEFFRRR